MIESPCLYICTLENGVCIGCKRTKEEISKWRDMTDEEKQKVEVEEPDLGAHEAHEKRPHDSGDRARGTDQRCLRTRERGHVHQARDHAGGQVEGGEQRPSVGVLGERARDVEEQHVA